MSDVSSVERPNVAQRDRRNVQQGVLLGASRRGQWTGIGDGDRQERRDRGLHHERLPTEGGIGGCLRNGAWGCSEEPRQGGKSDDAPGTAFFFMCHGCTILSAAAKRSRG